MYCEDCGRMVQMELAEYMQRKEQLGTVICTDCQNAWARTTDPLLQRVS